MLRPGESLALHRQGLLLSSFHPMSHLTGTSNITTRASNQLPAAGLPRAGHAALRAASRGRRGSQRRINEVKTGREDRRERRQAGLKPELRSASLLFSPRSPASSAVRISLLGVPRVSQDFPARLSRSLPAVLGMPELSATRGNRDESGLARLCRTGFAPQGSTERFQLCFSFT